MFEVKIYDFSNYEQLRDLLTDDQQFRPRVLDSDFLNRVKSKVDELLVAEEGARRYIEAINRRKGAAVLGFFTGGTSEPIYEALRNAYSSRKISFRSVTTFNMDEYAGLPFRHEQNYRRFMNENLFKCVDIDAHRTFFPDCMNGRELEEGEYDFLIEIMGGIDVQGGGIGTNGHMAFVEPKPLSFYVKNPSYFMTGKRELTPETRKANSRYFGHDESKVPTHAFTMGPGTLLKTKELDIYVIGRHKADAVKKAIEGPVTTEVPASLVREHGNGAFILDSAAASKLEREYETVSSVNDETLKRALTLVKREYMWKRDDDDEAYTIAAFGMTRD